MDYYAARQQHLEWLQENLAQEEAKLAEAQALVIQLQGSITYYRQAIEQLAPRSLESPDSNSFQRDNSSQENSNSRKVGEHPNLLEGSASQPENDYFDKEGEERRKPKDMMRPQYKKEGKTLGDVIQEFLEAKIGKALGSEYITREIFEVLSDEDFQRAKNSLSAELRRGAKEGRWKQVGRGSFTANSDLHK